MCLDGGTEVVKAVMQVVDVVEAVALVVHGNK